MYVQTGNFMQNRTTTERYGFTTVKQFSEDNLKGSVLFL